MAWAVSFLIFLGFTNYVPAQSGTSCPPSLVRKMATLPPDSLQRLSVLNEDCGQKVAAQIFEAYLKTGTVKSATRLNALAEYTEGNLNEYVADRASELFLKYPSMLGSNIAEGNLKSLRQAIIAGLNFTMASSDEPARDLRRMKAEVNGKLARYKSGPKTRQAVNGILNEVIY